MQFPRGSSGARRIVLGCQHSIGLFRLCHRHMQRWCGRAVGHDLRCRDQPLPSGLADLRPLHLRLRSTRARCHRSGHQHGTWILRFGHSGLHPRDRIAVGRELHLGDERVRSGLTDFRKLHLLLRSALARCHRICHEHGIGLVRFCHGDLHQRDRIAVWRELHLDDECLRSGRTDFGQLHLRLWSTHARCHRIGHQHGIGLRRLGHGDLHQRLSVAVGSELHLDDEPVRGGLSDCRQLHLFLWSADPQQHGRCH